MDLFTLSAKLGLDTSGYENGVKGAVESGKSLGEKLSSSFEKIKKAATLALSVGAIKKGIDSIVNLANETAAAGDKIDKQSQALGLSRKAYQEWDYILSQSGSSIDSLGVSMKTLNSAVLSAVDGGKEAKSAFAQLGLGIHEIENLSMEDQFEAVVRAFQKMPAGAKKSALAVQLFGKNGMELLPLLNSSTTSIDELRQAAEELGLIMSDDAIDASVAYNDAMDTMKRSFNALKYNIGSQLLPAMTNGMNKLAGYAGKLSKAYGEGGFTAVASTLVEDFKNIKWPTWSDVKNAASIAWNTIVRGVGGLAKIVFGENVDGTIAWPTWEDVKDAAGTAWEAIKTGAASIADTLGGLIFGRAEDGTVAWPDTTQLSEDFKTWWTNTALPELQKGMSWTLQLFGMPKESTDDISEVIGTWWNTNVQSILDGLTWYLNLPQTPAHEAGEQLRQNIENWWNGFVASAQALLKWVLGIPEMEDEDGTTTGDKIKAWWNDKVVPLLKNALNFTLGLFGLPDVDEMVQKIRRWWAKVKASVTLGLTATVEHVRTYTPKDETGVPSYDAPTMPVELPEWDQGYSFAKGMWDVPYDDYATRLHRGEMVLNASRARDYREGNAGSFDMSALVSAMESAVRSGMQGVTVKSYLNGRDITDDVNRYTVQQLKARRFAT